MEFPDNPDSNQRRGQTNWCGGIISKDGHHQFFASMHMHATSSLGTEIYFLSLWIWAGLMIALTNTTQQNDILDL